MTRRLLITGASGFIGTNLLEHLKKNMPVDEILAVDSIKPAFDAPWQEADVTQTDWSFLDSFKPTHVIHLAALTNHRLCADLTHAMATNVVATQHLFSKLASLGGVSKIIFPSSIVVYANHARMPLQEDTSPLDYHHNHYSLTKGFCEEICQHFRSPPYNLPILTFRLSNIYGPHQEWRAEKFPNLIPQIITQSIRDKRIEVWNQTPVRDFVYVGDAVKAFLKGLESPYNGIINIASGIGSSVGAICTEVSTLTKAPITDLGKQTSGPSQVVCDTSKARTHLGWQSTTHLPEGIQATVAYYQGIV